MGISELPIRGISHRVPSYMPRLPQMISVLVWFFITPKGRFCSQCKTSPATQRLAKGVWRCEACALKDIARIFGTPVPKDPDAK